MDDDFEQKLLRALKASEKKSQERYDAATGARGSTNNSSCNFYLGAKAVMRDVIATIESHDITKISEWKK
jgi:hypothetical protein